MRVYLSARFGRQAELRKYSRELRRAGVDVVCQWLTAAHDTPAEWPTAAIVDLVDVCAADVLVAFTDGPGSVLGGRGGRHVEYGIAVGLSLGMRPGASIRLIVCGPREHAFHYLPGVEHVETWAEARALIIDAGAAAELAVVVNAAHKRKGTRERSNL